MFLSKRSFCGRWLRILFLQIWIFFHHFEISLIVTNSPSKSLHYLQARYHLSYHGEFLPYLAELIQSMNHSDFIFKNLQFLKHKFFINIFHISTVNSS